MSVTDLDGSGLVLQNNGGDDLAVSASSTSTFATLLASGATYQVKVKTQPRMLTQTCSVSGGAGTVARAAVTGISVSCVTPKPLFAYAANSNDASGTNLAATGSVAAYKVGASGSLAESKTGGVWEPVARRPAAVAVDPLAQFVYVARSGDGGTAALVAYSLAASTGALTLRSGVAQYASVSYPQALAFSPEGGQLFVAGNGSGGGAQLAVHTVDTVTGAVGTASTTTFDAGYEVASLAVDPMGRYVIVGLTSASAHRLAVFRRSATDSALTPWASLVSLASVPRALAIDPGGRWLYVASNGGTTGTQVVRAFELPAASAGESLAPIGSAINVGGAPVDLAVHPRGSFLYVLRKVDERVSVFPIATGGGLGAESTNPTAADHGTGLSPASLRIDAPGTYAYVTNTGSNTISVYSVSRTTGLLTPAGVPAGTDTAPLGLALIAR